MKQLLVDVIGLLGMGCIVRGAWEVYQPAAWIVGGAALVIWAILASRK